MVLEGQLLLLIFVNDVPDAIEALKLFMADDVKMAQNLSMQRSPVTTYGQPINPAKSGFLDRSGFPIPTSTIVKYLWGSDRQRILFICWALTPCSGYDF